jgi:Phosphotransferase enzyme family
MEQVSSIEAELLKARLPSIGCIYGDPLTGFEVRRLGLSVSRPFKLRSDRGPWSSIRSYLKACISAEQTWLTECPEACVLSRRRAYPDEPPNSHISYFMPLVAILGRIVGNAEFLDRVDPSIAHFSLFHDDFSSSNILVGYEDCDRVVGVVDWEGARVLPMWACYRESLVAEPLIPGFTQYLSLRELRKQLLFDMVPGLSKTEDEVGLALSRLHYLASSCVSATMSISFVTQYLQDKLCNLKPLGEDAFAELREFVASQTARA